jgi:hypothetical protein
METTKKQKASTQGIGSEVTPADRAPRAAANEATPSRRRSDEMQTAHHCDRSRRPRERAASNDRRDGALSRLPRSIRGRKARFSATSNSSSSELTAVDTILPSVRPDVTAHVKGTETLSRRDRNNHQKERIPSIWLSPFRGSSARSRPPLDGSRWKNARLRPRLFV